MGQINQYLYNWYDPVASGNFISTSINNKTLADGFDFTENPIIKLGIKAPPGTRFLINGNVFVINPSGTLTINKQGYEIKTLKLIRDYKVKRNTDLENEQKDQGIKTINLALGNLLTNLQPQISVEVEPENSNQTKKIKINTIITNSDAAIACIDALSEFLVKFKDGYNDLAQSIEGIYTPIDIGNGAQLEEVYNVLIDIEQKK